MPPSPRGLKKKPGPAVFVSSRRPQSAGTGPADSQAIWPVVSLPHDPRSIRHSVDDNSVPVRPPPHTCAASPSPPAPLVPDMCAYPPPVPTVSLAVVPCGPLAVGTLAVGLEEFGGSKIPPPPGDCASWDTALHPRYLLTCLLGKLSNTCTC